MATNDFVIEHNFQPPEPLDRTIANLDMRCLSNATDNGLELTVTASFGSDYIEIPLSDGGILEVKCEIAQAIIVAKTYNCNLTDKGVEAAAGFQYRESFKETKQTATTTQIGAATELSANKASAPVEASAKFSAGRNHDGNRSRMVHVEGESEYAQVQYGQDQIRIFSNPDKGPLEGNLVDRATCFKVVPIDAAKPFGVLLQTLVSRNWISLSDPKPVTTSDRLKRLLERVFVGTDHIDEFHRRAFKLLLEHLVAKGLQTSGGTKYATLAARAVRAVRLEEGDLDHRYPEIMARSFVVPVEDIEAVLFEAPETVEKLLLSHGLSGEDIEAVTGERVIFVPSGNYHGSLVDLVSSMESKYEVLLRVPMTLRKRSDDRLKLMVPLEFVREYTSDVPKRSARFGCTGIEIEVTEEGLNIFYLKDGKRKTTQTRRGRSFRSSSH